MSRHLIIDRGDLESYVGRTLADSEVARIADAIRTSPIPAALNTIANEAIVRYRWNEHTTDTGGWCPHSEEPVTPEAEPADHANGLASCPTGCRASRPVPVGEEDDHDDPDGEQASAGAGSTARAGSVCDADPT